MLKFLLVSYLILAFISFIGTVDSECKFVKLRTNETVTKKKRLLQRLLSIKPKRFSVDYTEPSMNKTKHTYMFGICTDANTEEGDKNAGLVQIIVGGSHGPKPQHVIIGKFSETDILGGDSWILLTYYGGQAYAAYCQKEPRKAAILVLCDRSAKKPVFKFIEENRDKDSDCSYVFELTTFEICQAEEKKKEPGLSSGSVFCIIFFTTAGIYLAIGVMYRRVIIGAKGLEQIPNYSFWKDFGSLTADGCNFVCRCEGRQEANVYRGIDDNLASDFSDIGDRDDTLLRP